MGLRAIMVAVDYSDLLAVTIPYNRHHFSEVTIVTDHASLPSVHPIAHEYECRMFVTDTFYRNGAVFNKWAALEEGLDFIGREGWLCVMDADVLWPQSLQHYEPQRPNLVEMVLGSCALIPGLLYSPLRHMLDNTSLGACNGKLPEERDWHRFPIHRNVNEWAGYTQIFHASDPALGAAPWHQTDWIHAGGADSFFQAKWPVQHKVRPSWNVLHLGDAGKNWFGRATPYLTGNVNAQAEVRLASCQSIWAQRRANRLKGVDQFEGEKIKEG